MFEIEPDTVMIDATKYPGAIDLARGILCSTGRSEDCILGTIDQVQLPTEIKKCTIQSKKSIILTLNQKKQADIHTYEPDTIVHETQDESSMSALKPSTGLLKKASGHRNI